MSRIFAAVTLIALAWTSPALAQNPPTHSCLLFPLYQDDPENEPDLWNFYCDANFYDQNNPPCQYLDASLLVKSYTELWPYDACPTTGHGCFPFTHYCPPPKDREPAKGKEAANSRALRPLTVNRPQVPATIVNLQPEANGVGYPPGLKHAMTHKIILKNPARLLVRHARPPIRETPPSWLRLGPPQLDPPVYFRVSQLERIPSDDVPTFYYQRYRYLGLEAPATDEEKANAVTVTSTHTCNDFIWVAKFPVGGGGGMRNVMLVRAAVP